MILGPCPTTHHALLPTARPTLECQFRLIVGQEGLQATSVPSDRARTTRQNASVPAIALRQIGTSVFALDTERRLWRVDGTSEPVVMWAPLIRPNGTRGASRVSSRRTRPRAAAARARRGRLLEHLHRRARLSLVLDRSARV